MKAVILLLLATINCGFVGRHYEWAKEHAPFKVYSPEENPHRDWTEEQLRAYFNVHLKYPAGLEKKAYTPNDIELDWRTQVPECKDTVRDQAQCGSCWAFALVEVAGWRWCLNHGNQYVKLAPQDPVSCDYMDLACDGGYPEYSWQYMVNTGVVTEDCFPYSSQYGTVEDCITECKDGSAWTKYQAQDYSAYSGVDEVKQALQDGPVEAAFSVYEDFMDYMGGIYEYTYGDFLGGHAVMIVGYGNEDGKDYWIVQNSWTEDWGEQGYFRIKFGECGFEDQCYAGTM